MNRVVNRHVEKSTIDDEEEARNMTMVSPHLERIDEQSDGKQREGKSVIMGNTTESTFEEQDDETGTRAIERAVEVVRT